MAKSKLESKLKSATKKGVKKAIKNTKKTIKKTDKKAKKAIKKAGKKSKTRRSVSGRKYSGLSAYNKKKILERIEARKPHYEQRGRPKKESTFDTALVKTANERLRRLENEGLTEDSNEYRLLRKYAIENPNGKGKIYRVDDSGKVRFLTKTQYDNLSPEEQKYYNDILKQFLHSETSTSTGIEKKYRKAYETFKENYGDSFEDLSFDKYKEFFKQFRDIVQADYANHFAYEALVQTLEFIDIEQAMTDNQLRKVIQYAYNDNWDKIPNKYINYNF